MTWSIALLALVGTVLNARKAWQGFIFWFVSNAWWCVHSFRIGEYALAALFGVYWLLSIYGVYCWLKKESK